MKEALFNELVGSIREAGKIRRGEKRPTNVTRIEQVDVKAIRGKFNLSQSEFATMLGISKRTLENWEQGIRRPTGAAHRLLEVAARFPNAVYDTVFDRDNVRGNAERGASRPVAAMKSGNTKSVTSRRRGSS